MFDLNSALKILSLDKKYNTYNIDNLDIQELKKYYYIAALNYHPDKNIDIDTSDIFKNINNAYSYLKSYIENNYNYRKDFNKEFDNDLNFVTLLLSFINLLSISERNEVTIVNNFNKFKK